MQRHIIEKLVEARTKSAMSDKVQAWRAILLGWRGGVIAFDSFEEAVGRHAFAFQVERRLKSGRMSKPRTSVSSCAHTRLPKAASRFRCWWSVVCRSHLATFDTKPCNRPNHFSLPQLLQRWLAHLAATSKSFMPLAWVVPARSLSSIGLPFNKQNILHACEAVKKVTFVAGIERCRTPSVTGANLLAEAGRSSHLRLSIIITAQLASSRQCRVTVPLTPDYADYIAQTQNNSHRLSFLNPPSPIATYRAPQPDNRASCVLHITLEELRAVPFA